MKNLIRSANQVTKIESLAQKSSTKTGVVYKKNSWKTLLTIIVYSLHFTMCTSFTSIQRDRSITILKGVIFGHCGDQMIGKNQNSKQKMASH